MRPRRTAPLAAAGVTVALLATPTGALAAGGPTFANVLLGFLVIAAVFCTLWAVFFLSPLRRYLLRTRRRRHAVVLIVLGLCGLMLGAASLALGKASIGSGVAIRELEPQRFWQLVVLQLGSGCILLVRGLLSRSRDT